MSQFETKQKMAIYFRTWILEEGQKFATTYSHGYNEHDQFKRKCSLVPKSQIIIELQANFDLWSVSEIDLRSDHAKQISFLS